MRRIFDELVKIEGVIGGLLVGRDGLVVQSLMVEEEDAEVLGALAANMFDTIAKTTQRLGIGPLNDAIVEARDGSLQMRGAGDLVLVVICQHPIRLGEVRLAMSRAARLVEEEFAG
ncbi:MAG TPA: roadblock/LC7 domain-containing protein [Chloroflexia bacterium]|nr:roadblock/LC7 domain-containing protein [Chloroflexia bacterium]